MKGGDFKFIALQLVINLSDKGYEIIRFLYVKNHSNAPNRV